MGLGSALGYLNLTLSDEEEGEGRGGSLTRSTTPVKSSAAAGQGLGPAPGLGLGRGARKSRPKGVDHTRSVLMGTIHQRLGHVLLQVAAAAPSTAPFIALFTAPSIYIPSPSSYIPLDELALEPMLQSITVPPPLLPHERYLPSN